jgi:hypothetical protein
MRFTASRVKNATGMVSWNVTGTCYVRSMRLEIVRHLHGPAYAWTEACMKITRSGECWGQMYACQVRIMCEKYQIRKFSKMISNSSTQFTESRVKNATGMVFWHVSGTC